MIKLESRSIPVMRKIRGAGQETVKAVRGAMFDSGHDLIKSANTAVLREVKTGRIYKVKTRGGRRRTHRASGAGQSHANLSGTLRRSLQFQLHGIKAIEFGYGASRSNAPEYAEFLEGGTSKMAARPTLENALNREESTIINNFERNLDRVFK